MTGPENTQIVKDVYAAFGRGDVAAILARLTEDVEWTLEGPAVIPFAGKRRGAAEVAGFFQALGSTTENGQLTTEHYIAQDDKVVTVGRFRATVKESGKTIDMAVAHVFSFREGKIARFDDFIDTAQVADAYTSRAAAAR